MSSRLSTILAIVMTWFVAFYVLQRDAENHQDTIRLSDSSYTREVIKPIRQPAPAPKDYVVTSIKEKKLAQAIVRLYRHVNLEEAERVVRLTFHHARKHSISPTLALGLIAAESSFRHDAVSIVGATGYTQVYPKYHREKIRGRDLTKAHVAIEVGMQVLSDCIQRRKELKRALACYNGAITPANADKYYETVTQRKQQLLRVAGL